VCLTVPLADDVRDHEPTFDPTFAAGSGAAQPSNPDLG
jgi:hypothetical protein